MGNDRNDKNKIELDMLINSAFETIITNTKDMVFIKNADLVYVAASIPFIKMVGKNKTDEVVGHTDEEIFADKSLAKRYVSDDRKLMAKGENLVDYIEPITEEDGHARYGSTSKYLLRDKDGVVIGILGITKDITKDYVARQHHQKELKYLFKLPKETLAVSYIDIDSWRIISQRRQRIEQGTLEECQTVEELLEAALEAIVDKSSAVYKFYKNFSAGYISKINESGRNLLSFSYQRRLTDGSLKWVHNEVRLLRDADSGHLCAMLSAKDIDDEKKAEESLYAAAKLDMMTMVLNRETTMERMEEILINESDSTHVLFMIDVDNFKSLNDTRGHQAGDEFLIEFAKIIKESFRETDIVGRIGGDEFFAFMRNVSGSAMAVRKAEELLYSIRKLCEDYNDVYLSSSIGVAMYPENGKSVDDLYAEADSSLYQAKRSGKNKYVFS